MRGKAGALTGRKKEALVRTDPPVQRPVQRGHAYSWVVIIGEGSILW
jgi:hypothetical protein